MQVTNDVKVSSIAPSDSPLALKEGDIYHAAVKERLPNNEAVLKVRNQEIKVKFEQPPISNQGKTTIEVVDPKQTPPLVRSAASQSNVQSSTVKPSDGAVLTALNDGKKVTDDVKAAAEMLQKKGIPLSKQTFQDIKNFIEHGEGTLSEKLETLSLIAKKGIDFTPLQMKSVHEALFGDSFANHLKDIDSGFVFSEVKGQVYQKPGDVYSAAMEGIKSGDLEKAIFLLKEAMKEDPSQSALLKKSVVQSEQLLRLAESKAGSPDAEKLLKLANNLLLSTLKQQSSTEVAVTPIEAPQENVLLNKVNDMIKAIKKEPDLARVIQEIENMSPQLPSDLVSSIQQSGEKAKKLLDIGKEMAARQELMSTLTSVAAEVNKKQADRHPQKADDSYQLNDELFASIPFESKDFIVKTISMKLSQAAIDFKSFKQDITKNLQTIEQGIGKTPAAKPLLEATIKQLDQTILRSDFMLYTDMKTEKKLLTASSQLSQAKQLLAQGEYPEARKIVADIKKMVDKIMFKPSDTRMQHFVSKEVAQLQPSSPGKQLLEAFDQAQIGLKQQPSARGVFEYMRQLGLTHEAEHAQALAQNGKSSGPESNLKNILLQLQNDPDSAGQHSGKVDAMLQNMTGQQLLSKNDASGLQSMMFNLPLVLKDQVENVKVYINSNGHSQKIDWENCSLFFLLETKKLGDLGISLKTNNRNLSIDIKNDSQGFKEKMEPLTDIAKERLEEIGYGIGGIHFSSLHVEKKQTPADEKQSIKQPIITEKGYDFSI
ncbi:hypothetical protein [Falsibacillus albus]|uniref:Flagellar hook-length control protein FliK n=1 Tax=Falsibacillus albus TaxID=2478915 RepID=A0A3L7K152_9BACI|nr:hypothetical protein [Falsibacillus albus]RLQ96798.1 hypothetical protein D9X91_06775 [Falsibacillus albus]